jgi:hypothetical protein
MSYQQYSKQSSISVRTANEIRLFIYKAAEPTTGQWLINSVSSNKNNNSFYCIRKSKAAPLPPFRHQGGEEV